MPGASAKNRNLWTGNYTLSGQSGLQAIYQVQTILILVKYPGDIKNAFTEQVKGLVSGGVDALLVETSQDILEVKLAIEAIHDVLKNVGRKVPIIANMTLDQYGKMLLGTTFKPLIPQYLIWLLTCLN